jgi:hypothetical protein
MAGQSAASVRIAIKGKVLTAPIGTTAPVDVTTAWGVGWNDHGFTDQTGVLVTPKITSYDVKAWQSDTPIRSRITERIREVQVKLIQGGGLNSVLFNGGGSWAALGAILNISSPTYTATTATDSGATWTVNAYAGRTITAGSSTGVIVSNTATAATITAWTGGTPTAGTAFSISGSPVVFQYTPPTPGIDDNRMLGLEWVDNAVTKREVYTSAIVLNVNGYALKATGEVQYDVTFRCLTDSWFILSNDPLDNPLPSLVA